MTLDEAQRRCEDYMVRCGASPERAHELWLQRPLTLEPQRANEDVTDELWGRIQAHFRAIVKHQPSPAEVSYEG